MKTQIYTVTHKPVMFNLREGYQWIQVNASKNGRWAGYLHDNDGEEHISSKNPSYCELTALYNLWKESSAIIVGLCHYRRFLGDGLFASLAEETGVQIKKSSINTFILKATKAERYLKRYDILLTKPYPVNVYEDLLRFVYPCDIETMIHVIEQSFPEYSDSMWQVLTSKSISYCNMFIAKKDTVSEYCTWLFDVLSKIEERIDTSSYDTSHTRVFGYLAEVLLNIYVNHQQLSVKYLPMVSLDEDDTHISVKRLTHIAWNMSLAVLGITPKRWKKFLWKARHDYYLTRKEPDLRCYPSFEHLVEYFTALGGEDLKNNISPAPYLSTSFGSSTIYAFWCDTESQLEPILKEIHAISKKETPFGEAINVRIYISDSLKGLTKKWLQQDFYYVEDDLFKYYCSKNTNRFNSLFELDNR